MKQVATGIFPHILHKSLERFRRQAAKTQARSIIIFLILLFFKNRIQHKQSQQTKQCKPRMPLVCLPPNKKSATTTTIVFCKINLLKYLIESNRIVQYIRCKLLFILFFKKKIIYFTLTNWRNVGRTQWSLFVAAARASLLDDTAARECKRYFQQRLQKHKTLSFRLLTDLIEQVLVREPTRSPQCALRTCRRTANNVLRRQWPAKHI